MKIYEKADFIEFCKSKGYERYVGGDICNCAMSQFMKSKDARVRRSYIGAPNDEFRLGAGEGGLLSGAILGLRITEEEAMAVVQAAPPTFANAAHILESM